MSIEKVLIIDEDLASCNFLSELLRRRKSEVFVALDRAKGLEILHEHLFDLVICDLKTEGLAVLKSAKNLNPKTLVILTTAVACMENAVEAMRLGAFNYLLKPLSSDTIEPMLERVEEHIDLLRENNYLREEISSHPDRKKHLLIAESEVMQQILSDVGKIAKSSSSVFISGESGTGKEVIAHAIHKQSQGLCNLSSKSTAPLFLTPCSNQNSSVMKKEHFTGATIKGLDGFELADGGSLLLDEITEIPLASKVNSFALTQEHGI